MPLDTLLPELTSPAPLVSATPLSWARRAEPAELPELMDEPGPYTELRDCLRDLAEVNRITRGYAPTLAFLDRIASTRTSSDPLRILDVGSGGGDTLRAVAHWAADRKLPVELTGIDLNPHSARAALEFSRQDPLAAQINFVTSDVFSYMPAEPPDVILSALFTHHLSSPEIVRFIRWMDEHARLGWFINDLHRSRSAAFWFRFLPVIFGWHRFVLHDGPVSLHRAFLLEDWLHLLHRAGIHQVQIKSHPMNRLCVARIHQLT